MEFKLSSVIFLAVICLAEAVPKPQAPPAAEVTAKPYVHQQCVIRTGHPTECHEFREAEAKRHKTYLQAVHDKNFTLANTLAEPFAVFKSEKDGPNPTTIAPMAKAYVPRTCTPKADDPKSCDLDNAYEAKRFEQYQKAIKEGDIEEANLMALSAYAEDTAMPNKTPKA